ncbi:MAG: hypothetical protein RIS54_354 [Verrucomicrobiota bacterium]|jgi:sodium-dependent dicarboxylate transporter 2/3/5
MRAPRVQTLGLVIAPLLAVTSGWLAVQIGGWTHEQGFMTAILVLAATLWISETVPLFVTAIVVVALEILLLGNPGRWTFFGYADGTGPNAGAFLNAAVSPTLALFFAGLVMARAAVKEGVDQAMGGSIFRGHVTDQ